MVQSQKILIIAVEMIMAMGVLSISTIKAEGKMHSTTKALPECYRKSG